MLTTTRLRPLTPRDLPYILAREHLLTEQTLARRITKQRWNGIVYPGADGLASGYLLFRVRPARGNGHGVCIVKAIHAESSDGYNRLIQELLASSCDVVCYLEPYATCFDYTVRLFKESGFKVCDLASGNTRLSLRKTAPF